jgi:nifR3 family TIM-barrel protein
MRFGALELKTNLLLSPLAGYTNLPFRLVVREVGGIGLCTTDLVNARSLLEKNHKALKLIETRPEDFPLAVQLFGSVPEEMTAAAQYLEAQGVASIDINMGCPVRKVCQVGGGSAMMTQHDKTAALVRQMINAVKIPVTCKMRLGWDDDNITAPELARALADVGVAAIMVHGRTRQQGFSGQVNLAGIRAVVQAVPSLPVIGNGDITTPQAAKQMLESTGCAGISIGRGAFYNPWIFQDTLTYLETGEVPPEPPFAQRLVVMRRHFDLMIEIFGENLGCKMFRKVGPWYARQFGPASFFNKRIVRVSTRTDFLQLLEDYLVWRAPFLDENGQLLPRYQHVLAQPEYRDEETPLSTQRTQIAVPSGANELW